MPNSGLIIFLIVIVLIAVYFLLSNQEYVPGVDFKISPSNVQIKDNSFSNIVTITVTKTDNENEQTDFLIKLIPEANTVYAISVNNNQTITEYRTKPLIDRDAFDILQFKIFGTLPGGFYPVTTHIKAQLLYNNKTLSGKEVTLTIDITQ